MMQRGWLTDWNETRARRLFEDEIAACIDAAIDARTELMEAEARHAALVIVRRERAGALREAAKECVDNMFSSNATDLVSTVYRTISHRLRARAAEEETNG